MKNLLFFAALSFSACASNPLPGSPNVDDSKLNRRISRLLEDYRTAMEGRDAERIAALVSSKFHEDNGTTDGGDDVSRGALLKRLSMRFEKTAELYLKLQLEEVTWVDDRIHARYRFQVRYRLVLPAGDRWESHDDFNEVVLVEENGSLKIASGI